MLVVIRAMMLLLLVAVAGHADATAAVQPVRIPILYEDSRVYVSVSAGGQTGWFILDTGATPTVLDQGFARRLHLRARNLQAVGGAGAGTSKQGELGPVRLSVDGVALNVPDAYQLDLARLLGPTSGREPAGIIGSQFFRDHVVEVDFRAHELRVWPKQTDLARRYARTVPLSFDDWTPLASAELTLPSGARLPEKVLVDLGAKSTLLIPEPFIAAHKLDSTFAAGVVLPLGAGVGGDTFYRFVRAPRIALGGDPALAIDQPAVGLSVRGSLRSTWHEGLLGTDYLSRFNVAFDYAHSRLLLTRLSERAEPLDRSGLFVVWSGAPSRFTVRDVLAAGPGDKAGVRVGDTLLSIGGQSAAKLSLSQVRRLLKSDAGELPLLVRRNGKERRLMLQLADLIPAA